MAIIYKATNKYNNKSYIGKTKTTLEKRKVMHERNAFSKETPFIFHRALRKYGKKAFTWEVLEKCNEALLSEKEVFYIAKYKTFIGDDCCLGYNMTTGGEGGNTIGKHPNKKQISQKISKSNKGDNHFLNRMDAKEKDKWVCENLRGKNNPCYNRIVPKEQRQKASERMLGKKNHYYGKKHSDEIRKKMSINGKGKITGEKNPNYGKTGAKNHLAKKYIITFENNCEYLIISLVDFCLWYEKKEGVKLYPQLLSSVAKGVNKTHRGLKCRYALEKDKGTPLFKM